MSLKKLFIIINCLVATSAFAQQDFSKVQIETIPVAKGVYMLVGSGGSMEGVIAGVDEVLDRIDDNTKVIPGHGPLGNKSALKTYRDMLATVHERITKLIKEGKNIDEIVDAKPTADYDAKWGGGFLKPDQWVQIAYAVMQK